MIALLPKAPHDRDFGRKSKVFRAATALFRPKS
jgi:hypothetical protein